jgi:hypothetical protein
MKHTKTPINAVGTPSSRNTHCHSCHPLHRPFRS